MNVQVAQGAIQTFDADTIVVNLFAAVTSPGGATGAVDDALGGLISELIAAGDISGKAGVVSVLYPRGALPAQRVLVVGLGEREQFNLEAARQAAAAAARRARELQTVHLATIAHGAGVGGLDPQAAAEATLEGTLLALYSFAAIKEQQEPPHAVSQVSLVELDADKLPALQTAAAQATATVAGVNLARDLVNLPPNYCTPEYMAQTAVEIAQAHGLTALIGDRAWAEAHHMGAFLAVAKGAGDEPRFVVLEHNAERSDLPTIVLVGKGITFDSGGISIKPSAEMWRMKNDMGGAAAVLGAMKAVGELGLPLRVIGICPCTENKPDAHAYRPADVITASNGKTIEIISTDAEGRMALADALVYAGRYSPDVVVDLATLTGTAVAALGHMVAAALFSTDDRIRDWLVAAGTATHERVWPMPLWPDYPERIKSPVADMRNSGGRTGGLGTSAAFLQRFTDYTWAHLDIAGMALTDKDEGYIPSGGTGYGVRLLVRALRGWA